MDYPDDFIFFITDDVQSFLWVDFFFETGKTII